MASTLSGPNRKDCPMRHFSNGNCLVCGGFCLAVKDEICEALHQAYNKGYDAGYGRAQAEEYWDKPMLHHWDD